MSWEGGFGLLPSFLSIRLFIFYSRPTYYQPAAYIHFTLSPPAGRGRRFFRPEGVIAPFPVSGDEKGRSNLWRLRRLSALFAALCGDHSTGSFAPLRIYLITV
jgi:hypothetical protein